MFGRWLVAVVACLGVCGGSGAADAQVMQGTGDVHAAISGAWQGVIGSPTDPIQIVKVFNPNGQFTVMTVNRGRPFRFWGSYNVQQVGPDVVRLTYNAVGYLPRQFCTVGGPCTTLTVPPPGSGETFRVMGGMLRGADGSVLQRGPVPAAVMQPLPTTFMMPATVPPSFNGGGGGGVAPVIRPYTTPNGARYNSQPAQDFIYQNLRGCSPDYGTQHSYNNCK